MYKAHVSKSLHRKRLAWPGDTHNLEFGISWCICQPYKSFTGLRMLPASPAYVRIYPICEYSIALDIGSRALVSESLQSEMRLFIITRVGP